MILQANFPLFQSDLACWPEAFLSYYCWQRIRKVRLLYLVIVTNITLQKSFLKDRRTDSNGPPHCNSMLRCPKNSLAYTYRSTKQKPVATVIVQEQGKRNWLMTLTDSINSTVCHYNLEQYITVLSGYLSACSIRVANLVEVDITTLDKKATEPVEWCFISVWY